MTDVHIAVKGAVSVATICRAPNNYFDMPLIADLTDAFKRFDRDPAVRSSLLESAGRYFAPRPTFPRRPSRRSAGVAAPTCIRKQCGCSVFSRQSSPVCRVR